ncbi:MAG: Mrp/NBP35 family ATP-binding protein [Anaerolineaceae bacterium]|jgi:ATP-binding protein involved in chromosome partitioning
MTSREEVLKALSQVLDPELKKDLVSLGMVDEITIDGENVCIKILLTTPACPLKNQIEREVRDTVLRETDLKTVEVIMGARVNNPNEINLGGNKFKFVIAIGSGKGGVGKSTVSVAVASALAQQGAKVGLLDADIYGPNIPRMLGVDNLPMTPESEKLNLPVANGIKILSIGFMVQPGQPLLWRGPMLHTAIKQFLSDFNWGELDYLIVDMPPGTGDVQLSLSQLMQVSGAVVVTTPQQVSVDDAYRAISMFQKMNIPILGIIENMSYLVLPDEGKYYLFGEKGGERLAKNLNVPFLGGIPFDKEVVTNGDVGTPIRFTDTNSQTTKAFYEIAGKIAAQASQVAHHQ